MDDRELELFITGFHKLPQELQDIIHDYTFTVQQDGLIPVSSIGSFLVPYTVPAILQVDRNTRRTLRKLYFMGNRFCLSGSATKLQWLSAMRVPLVMCCNEDHSRTQCVLLSPDLCPSWSGRAGRCAEADFHHMEYPLRA